MPYLVKRSTMTMIVSLPSDFGSPSMKSMVISCQGPCGVERALSLTQGKAPSQPWLVYKCHNAAPVDRPISSWKASKNEP
jgi:hypothetical protein